METLFSAILTLLVAIFMSIVPYIFFLHVLEGVIEDESSRKVVSVIITAVIFLFAFGDNIQLFK
jgi:Kef-type K+ transport system membrane component KefB